MEGITQIKTGSLEETEIPVAVELFVGQRLGYVSPVADAKQAPGMPWIGRKNDGVVKYH